MRRECRRRRFGQLHNAALRSANNCHRENYNLRIKQANIDNSALNTVRDHRLRSPLQSNQGTARIYVDNPQKLLYGRFQKSA